MAIRKREEATEAGRRLPIVALTADAMKGTQERCMQAGMDDYLQKPLNVKLFRRTIAHWVQARGPGGSHRAV